MSCHALRVLDEMTCTRCGLRWDIGAERPECSPLAPIGETKRHKLNAPATRQAVPDVIGFRGGQLRVVDGLKEHGPGSAAHNAALAMLRANKWEEKK
jgi:hypothetical protein